MLPILNELAKLSADELASLTERQKAQIAQRLRLPAAALDEVVPSQQESLHYQGRCPMGSSVPKGPHPQMFALLKDCAGSSIYSTDPSQLQTKHVADQLRVICKHHVYEQFAHAIEEIWTALQPTLRDWRADANTYLGTLQEVSSDNDQRTMMLVPLGKEEKATLDGSPSLQALFVQLMHYTRSTWGAVIMQWSQQQAGRTGFAEYLPGYLTQTTERVPFREDLFRGVNTAIKINYSINYLLLALSDHIDSELTWRQLQEHNYSFAALWAAGSITTLAALTDNLVFYPDQDTLDYLADKKVISSYRSGQPGFEMLDPAYFCLNGQTPVKQALDLAESRMPEVRQFAAQADVIVKKCPALKIGVVKSMYDWINDIVTQAIKSAGHAPWPGGDA